MPISLISLSAARSFFWNYLEFVFFALPVKFNSKFVKMIWTKTRSFSVFNNFVRNRASIFLRPFRISTCFPRFALGFLSIFSCQLVFVHKIIFRGFAARGDLRIRAVAGVVWFAVFLIRLRYSIRRRFWVRLVRSWGWRYRKTGRLTQGLILQILKWLFQYSSLISTKRIDLTIILILKTNHFGGTLARDGRSSVGWNYSLRFGLKRVFARPAKIQKIESISWLDRRQN